jgi:hypothetical protein
MIVSLTVDGEEAARTLSGGLGPTLQSSHARLTTRQARMWKRMSQATERALVRNCEPAAELTAAGMQAISADTTSLHKFKRLAETRALLTWLGRELN